jgi:bacteriocin-like protein
MEKKQIETLSLEELAKVSGGRYGVNRPRNQGTTAKRRR